MFQSNEINASKISTTDAEPNTPVSSPNSQATRTASTKDAGRVHIGGGMMRFDTTKDAGRVHIGGGMMRF
jgi:hypothetical protein